ncbi:pyridoxal-phosphate dependent enzyme [Streptomyces sp. 3MP-14]|uniref:Pyridoxal-phosphate dependent enzyme n=1 Tax=Streptomyces mimosae TaxID=2586635 RepID=A0A5N6A9B4_9ACTN|nr:MULTISPECIES: serine/threonine dehydratase [Streptomyces]KAB8164593.1 pyridoxal-phosphate dependent enzyme [Streptomyces mimosae]KAB8175509.1 pyridoxal-phosphate dependent enzyme [Streptomyces sp. 3MP-14]
MSGENAGNAENKALGYADVRAAGERIAGGVRPVALAPAGERAWFALEFLQHTGSFKARGALNFLTARRAAGRLPEAGVAIASGGNAGLAAAWAAAREGVPATVFTPTTAPPVKVARLRALGAEVRQVGAEYAEAEKACAAFVAERGALASHAYDQPLVAAGAGTLVDEIVAARPSVTTVVVAVGGGGLLAGVAAAAAEHGLDVVAVEPERCRALHAALAAGRVVDVPVASVAADSLGARRVSADALWWAQQPHVRSVLVPDEEIVATRRRLWLDHRIAVEHAAATALAGAPKPPPDGEVCVVLCGANTDPSDLAG